MSDQVTDLQRRLDICIKQRDALTASRNEWMDKCAGLNRQWETGNIHRATLEADLRTLHGLWFVRVWKFFGGKLFGKGGTK